MKTKPVEVQVESIYSSLIIKTSKNNKEGVAESIYDLFKGRSRTFMINEVEIVGSDLIVDFYFKDAESFNKNFDSIKKKIGELI